MSYPVPAAPWRRRLVILAAVALGGLASATLNSGFVGAGRAYAQVPAEPVAPAAPATPKPAKAPKGAADAAVAKTATDLAPSVPAHSGAPAVAPPPAPPAAGAGGNDDDDASDDADTHSATKRTHPRGANVGITIDDNDGVHFSGLGGRQDYDSFQEFLQSAPWLAGMMFLSVTLFFLVPLLVIVLLIWYKVRKNRMLNETMLKLAERGVMPPAEAMAAIGAGATPATASPAAGALYDQARLLRDRRTWSDLRRGIILGAIGMGFQAYSLFDSGEANWLGLTLMFVGAGYILLWFFEDRRPMGPPAGGA
jgi:hypothetical protein